MKKVAEESIEEVRERVDLAAVAGQYTRLKREGKSWVGLSPFTDEKAPSFYVHPDKGFWKCFSSGKSGDAFKLIMEVEGLTFGQTVERLAEAFGVQLEYTEDSDHMRKEQTLRSELYDLYGKVAEWMHGLFLGNDSVREWWEDKRGFLLDEAKDWKIGFAPVASGQLMGLGRALGYDYSLLRESGLFLRENMMETFRGRLMIPVPDIQGRICGFAGRSIMGVPVSDDPWLNWEYVSTPTTPIFDKERLLFGADRVRKALAGDDNKPVCLVEGQLDVIRCQSHGILAIASMGTGLTAEQTAIIRRHFPSGKVLVWPDGDEFGREGGQRAIGALWERNLEVKLIWGGKSWVDPDMALREGKTRAEKLPVVDTMDWFREMDWTPERVVSWIRKMPSATNREHALKRLSDVFGVSAQAAIEDYRYHGSEPRKKYEDGKGTLEREILKIVFKEPNLCPFAARMLELSAISQDTKEGVFLRRLVSYYLEGILGEDSDIGVIVDVLQEDEEEEELLLQICLEQIEGNPEWALMRKAGKLMNIWKSGRVTAMLREASDSETTPERWKELWANVARWIGP